ncbi:MAG: tRNA (guanosine(46)-N7)-methyltransferase TrmB [Treponema sp.]|nr:tRNA (guanosine(46)-N7)-methyltransferase TrmB [Treponema sp.]
MHKSYVIRKGRFTAAQRKAYETSADNILIPFSENHLDYSSVFNRKNNNSEDVIMEIGFGSGSATAEIAQANPDKNYLGVEVHRPGIGRLLWETEKRSLSNVRIIEYDAAVVAQKMIAPCSLRGIHLFFPDPWPKKRHHKRRLVQRPFTDTLACCLMKGGYLYMVTDWEDYALHALEELTATAGLQNVYDNFAPHQSWRPVTRFERKGQAKDHLIRELYFIRN